MHIIRRYIGNRPNDARLMTHLRSRCANKRAAQNDDDRVPASMRVSIRQTYMTEGGAIIWQNRRLATGYSCVSSVEPGETQYPAVSFHAEVHGASPLHLRAYRLPRRDKRSVPVKAPGLHVDLPRDSMSSVRTPPCRRISSSGSSTRRSTPRWTERHVANRRWIYRSFLLSVIRAR